MYSQRILALILLFQKNNRKVTLEEVRKEIAVFKSHHLAIQTYIQSVSNEEWRDASVDAAFNKELTDKFDNFIRKVDKTLEVHFSGDLLREASELFLNTMDTSVKNIELLSQRKIEKLKTTQWIVLGSILLILAAQAFFIFFPLFRNLKNENALRKKAFDDLVSAQENLVVQGKLASLGALSAGIAHEIKNPINLIRNAALGIDEFVKNDIPKYIEKFDNRNDKELEYFREDMESIAKAGEIIVANGDRADAIVKSMLLQSRSGAADLCLVDINKLANESFVLAYHSMRAGNPFPVETSIQLLQEAPAEVWVYPQDLGRVFNNILNNSYYALKKKFDSKPAFKPKLSFAIKTSEGANLQFIIEDNGIGIPAEIKSKILEPFFTTKPAGQGTGLGLSMVNDVVRIHNGSLVIDSVENEFTKLTITIPKNLKSEARANG